MIKDLIINGFKKTEKKFTDTKGYLSKLIATKRLEKYANEIDMVLTKYNKKSCNETMMIKGFRKSSQETTNRKTHQELLELIVGQLSKEIGLSEKIAKIIGKHHDIGHTFLGHSGEWWISNILEDYAIGSFCHNTLGATNIIYSNKIYDEIIEKIKFHNPKISEKELSRVKDSLWIIMDAINAHNGEKPDKEYVPDFKKTEQDFYNEIVKCFSTPGYDRKITPATPEACLMRLADKIAYTPLDMIDAISEGMIRDENGNIIDYIDNDYKSVLIKLGITEDEIEMANIKKDFTPISDKLTSTFINDVVQNSNKKKIKMSEDTMKLMSKLLVLNNSKAVDNVVLIEDQQTYPKSIRILINQFKDIILKHDLLPLLYNANENFDINEQLKEYKNTPYESFINYICNMNSYDFDFTTKIVNEATKESIRNELNIARKCVERREQYKDKEELGLDYSAKNARIRSYISYYESQIESGNLIGYGQNELEEDVQRIFFNINNRKQNTNYLNMEERISMMIGARYLATLNDIEFMQLLQDTELIDQKQYTSLTRKYRDIPDLKGEAYIQANWKNITDLQKKALEEQSDTLGEQE